MIEYKLKNLISLNAIRIASVWATACLFSCNTAGAAEDELAQALREDKQLCSTPEGIKYEAKFLGVVTPKEMAAIKSCTNTTKSFEFDMAFKVSAEGKITRIVCTPNQPIAACVASKLKGVSGPRPLHGPCTIYAHYIHKPK